MEIIESEYETIYTNHYEEITIYTNHTIIGSCVADEGFPPPQQHITCHEPTTRPQQNMDTRIQHSSIILKN